ncbi:hypothetical protein J0H58_29510 [bacterium]|nr:hypothetical protein [bacterium]
MYQLPALQEGRTYTCAQVAPYLGRQKQGASGATDFDLILPWFRTNYFHRFRRNLVGPNEVVMEYQIWHASRFEATLPAIRQRYGLDRQRIDAVRSALLAGEPAFPVWIVGDYAASHPVPVKEGNHRLLAFAELELSRIPVFLARLEDVPS